MGLSGGKILTTILPTILSSSVESGSIVTESFEFTVDHNTMIKTTTPKIVYLLGYAGLLPFVACAVLAWFDEPISPFFVFHVFIIYSIVILAYLCGSWWGFSFAVAETGPRNTLLLGSIGLLLLLWLLLVFYQNEWAVVMLTAGYLVLYAGEKMNPALPVDGGYRRMRLLLTAVVVLCHASVFFAMTT